MISAIMALFLPARKAPIFVKTGHLCLMRFML